MVGENAQSPARRREDGLERGDELVAHAAAQEARVSVAGVIDGHQPEGGAVGDHVVPPHPQQRPRQEAGAIGHRRQRTTQRPATVRPWRPRGGRRRPARVPRSERDDGSEPLVRAGLRGFLALERRDVVAIVALVLLALFLRVASPIFPDFLSGNGGIGFAGMGAATSLNSPPAECTPPGGGVPVGAPGKDANGTPVNHVDVKECGFIFDEVYFPVDAAKDLRQPAESYFDPEPPLAKLLMAPPIAIMGFSTWSWRVSTAIFGSLLVERMVEAADKFSPWGYRLDSEAQSMEGN